jgi:branched-chain amino acid transport system permease protein
MLLAQTLVNGILLGGLYACMAMGFSLMWGVLGLINLAHGSMIVTGAYLTFWLNTHLGIDPILTLPSSAAILFVFGYAVQKYVINPVVSENIFLTLIITFGLDMMLINLNIILFTADVRSITTWYTGLALDVLGIRIAYTRLLVFVLALFLTLALHQFLKRSRTGRAIRAAAHDPKAARVLGLDIAHTYAVTFGLGAAMAGAVGSLIAIVYAFSPVTGAALTLKSFIVVILGGLGNVFGVILSGVFLGITENLVSSFGHPGYRDAISFGLMVAILVLRPTGFLGRRSYAVTRA